MKNFIFNLKHKYLNIICFALCAVFFMYAISFLFTSYSKQKSLENTFNYMMQYYDDLNIKISENSKLENTNSSNQTNEKFKLYSDGKTALVDAFNRVFIEAESYSAYTDGKFTISGLGGLYANVDFNFNIYQYSKSHCFEETISGIMDTNAPMSMLKSCFASVRRIYKNDKMKVKVSKNVNWEGKNLKADFTGCVVKESLTERFFSKNIYVISDDIIEKITYFKINYKNNKLENYYVQAELNPSKTTKNYAYAIQKSVDCTLPNFTKVIMTAIIDKNGNLLSFNTVDYFNMKISGIYVDTKSLMNYNIYNINEKIEFDYEEF